MSLSVVLGKIKEVQQFAEENTDIGPFETMPARRGRKNQAIEKLKQYRREYATELRRTAAYILVVGDKRNEFAQLATDGTSLAQKGFTTNPETFYEDLAKRLPPSLYQGKENLQNIFDILGRHLEDKMLSLDVNGYPQLIYRQEYGRTIRTYEEMLGLVKEALVSQVGGEIVGEQAIQSLLTEAIKRQHAAKLTPIVLPTADVKFALTVAKDLERITSKVFIVVAGEADVSTGSDETILVKEPSSDSVKKALKTISNQIKK